MDEWNHLYSNQHSIFAVPKYQTDSTLSMRAYSGNCVYMLIAVNNALSIKMSAIFFISEIIQAVGMFY